MTEQEVVALLDKYEAGDCTPEEAELLEKWYVHKAAASSDEVSPEDLWIRMEAGRDFIMAQIADGSSKQKRNFIKSWKWIAGVAAVAVLTMFGVYFFHTYHRGPKVILSSVRDLPPGKNTATLKFANGRTLVLSDTKTGVIIDASSLKYNDGSMVGQVNTAPGQDDLTVTTPRGGTYQVSLPDGTKVWLNAASSLTYSRSNNSNGRAREVTLSGEAYFEVFKDKHHPFIVKSRGQQIEVLGTHFNVNAYRDEPDVKTTLLEGSVNVNGNTTLKPNQQSIVNAGGIKVIEVTGENFTDWKDGLFNFENESLVSVMRKIARWYNVEVEYQGKTDAHKTYSGTVSRSGNISKVLEMLTESEGIRFRTEGNKLIVIN